MSKVRSSADIDRDMRSALQRARRELNKDPSLLGVKESAGFIIPPKGAGSPRSGVQVFVAIGVFDERLLAMYPETGGLYGYATSKQICDATMEE